MNAYKHGFWPEKHTHELNSGRNDGEMIALMHSELSEALEAVRKTKIEGEFQNHVMDEHCPGFLSLEIELADCIIRILDYSHARKLRLAEAIIAKHEYNKTRPFKHGKVF